MDYCFCLQCQQSQFLVDLYRLLEKHAEEVVFSAFETDEESRLTEIKITYRRVGNDG
jgi:hypothetical protein